LKYPADAGAWGLAVYRRDDLVLIYFLRRRSEVAKGFQETAAVTPGCIQACIPCRAGSDALAAVVLHRMVDPIKTSTT
jgi:hypothetical protein